MSPIVAPVAKLLATLTLIADLGILLYFASSVISLISKPLKNTREKLLKKIAPNARIFAFLVALTAMSGSLFYSDVAKYTPCLLCWWQRIFMYPQVLLIGLGIMKNDKNVSDYAMGFSAVGAVIASYHYYIQLGGKTFFTCGEIGYSASCTQRFSLEFGYITIPMMALSAFILIFLLMRLSKRYTK